MKSLMLIAAALVLASGGSSLLAQSAPGETPPASAPLDAKKAKELEKRKANLIKSIEKQVATAEKKLKLSEEQKQTIRPILTQYYVKRVPLAGSLRRAADPEAKKVARRDLRSWYKKLEKELSDKLDEKQMKALARINENDMAALNPPPASSGGGFGGGDGGGGGGGGDGD